MLQIVNAENVMVVVSRWFGGIHLGPDRFKHINNCTRSILESHGYLAQRVSFFSLFFGGNDMRTFNGDRTFNSFKNDGSISNACSHKANQCVLWFPVAD